jgi:protein-S-isoprenylcysteine O-methyltransferase Ste14
MTPRRIALSRGEGLGPWLAAPVLAVVLLVLAITQVPGRGCEDLAFQYIDDSGPRDLVIGLAIVESMLLGVAAVWCWAQLSPSASSAGRLPLVALALLAPPLVAVALSSSLEASKIFAVLAFAGSLGAIVGFFAVLNMQAEGVRLSQASSYLPLYLGATAWCLIPFIALISLTIARHPICEPFG